MDICIDFDGTCVTNDFPKIGREIGAVPVLKALIANGHRLILSTMRSDMNDIATEEATGIVDYSKQYLQHAVLWFKANEIPLFGIQTNPEQKQWSKSPKPFGHLYIDDAGLGMPLCKVGHRKPFVNWIRVEKLLVQEGLLRENEVFLYV